MNNLLSCALHILLFLLVHVVVFFNVQFFIAFIHILYGGRTGLVVRALDSRSGNPGSILGRVGVLFP